MISSQICLYDVLPYLSTLNFLELSRIACTAWLASETTRFFCMGLVIMKLCENDSNDGINDALLKT